MSWAIQTDVTTVKTNVSTIKTNVSTIKTNVSTIKTDVATIKTDVATIKTDVATIKTDVATIKTDVQEKFEQLAASVWVSDYKLHGEKSYVFNDKRVYNKMCVSPEAVNDLDLSTETFNYIIGNDAVKNNAGKWFSAIYGIDNADTLQGLTDIDSVAASTTAMNAVIASTTAMNAVAASTTAMNAIDSSSNANVYIGKIVANRAGLNAADYADMNAVIASTTAMNAVIASTTAMKAVAASTVALDALYAKRTTMTGASKTYSGKVIILEISSNNTWNTSSYGYATLSDGSKPSWDGYTGKYAYFKKYPMYATYIKNDTESNDSITYYKIS